MQNRLRGEDNGSSTLLHRLLHVAGKEIREREIGGAHGIGRVLLHQCVVFLDCFVRLPRHQVVATTGAVLFAIAHAIDMRHGRLIILFRISFAAHVRTHHGHTGVSAAHVRIERYGSGIMRQSFFPFAGKLKVLRNGVFMDSLKRTGSYGFLLLEARGFRRSVAEQAAHLVGQLCHSLEHAGLCIGFSFGRA